MHYGKQLHSNNVISYISSSLPLIYSDFLIELTEEEFLLGLEQTKIKKIEEKKQRLSKQTRHQFLETVEPNQPIQVKDEEE